MFRFWLISVDLWVLSNSPKIYLTGRNKSVRSLTISRLNSSKLAFTLIFQKRRSYYWFCMIPCTLIQIELQMEISLFNMFVYFTSFNMKENLHSCYVHNQRRKTSLNCMFYSCRLFYTVLNVSYKYNLSLWE